MDGASLLSTTVALVVVCALAVGVLRAIGGRGARGSNGMRVLGRLPVEARRSVVVVEVAGRCFLVGVGDGPMALLAELDAAEARARLLGAAANDLPLAAGAANDLLRAPGAAANALPLGAGAAVVAGAPSVAGTPAVGGVFRAALARVLGGASARSGRAG